MLSFLMYNGATSCEAQKRDKGGNPKAMKYLCDSGLV